MELTQYDNVKAVVKYIGVPCTSGNQLRVHFASYHDIACGNDTRMYFPSRVRRKYGYEL